MGKVASEWQEIPIKSLSLGIYDGPHATPKKTDSGPIFLGISNLESGRLNLSDVEHLSEDDFEQWTRRITPQKDDLVFSYETRLGEAALIPEGLKCCLGRRMALIRFDPNKADPKFMLYAYLGPQFQSVLKARTIHGSTVDRIPLVDFPNFPIAVPPLPIQRQIAAILSAFDDKIELNRRMNRTLEAMARALFKSWFVDFDPVRAKMRGEQPEGMDEETAALFPDELVEIDGREVPKGWAVTPIKSLCESVQNGATPKRLHDDFWANGTINWFKTGELTESFLFESEEKITEMGLSGSSAKLWPAGTVLIAIYAAPTVGRLGILTRPSTSNQACSALIPKAEIGSYYIWHTLFEAREWLNTISVGAAQQNISKGVVEAIPAIVATPKIMKIFNQQVSVYWEAQKSIQLESAQLAQLRDALLPRLLAGEIDVSGWEEGV